MQQVRSHLGRGSRGPIAGARRHIYVNLNSLNSQKNYTDKCYRRNTCAGEGALQQRLEIYLDNFTVLSVIGRICVRGKGA